MGSFPPPAGAAPPPAGAAVTNGKATLAQASAAGTTIGAPTPLSVGAPPPVAVQPPAMPPIGATAPVNPPVAPHVQQQSVGTHQRASPLKRGNPTFGMSK
jgi:hypothetical protein